MNVLYFIGGYFLALNILGFAIMGIDKKRARRRIWRISEATLFTVALFGGCIGCIAGMYTFRHKTQKPAFFIGMPVILGLQVIAVAVLLIFKPVLFSVM